MDEPITFIEKYKPKKYDDLVLETNLKERIRKLKLQNLIITGYTGTGKSTILRCLAKEIYKTYVNEYVYVLDVIDDRSLKTVNEMLETFCKKKIGDSIRKMVIIDDIDEISTKIQQIINNLMEIYEKKVIFTFTCVNMMNVLEALQSRCIVLRLGKLSDDLIREQLIKICMNESIKCTEDAMDYIIEISNNDLRKAINNLQMISSYSNEIVIENVINLCNLPEQEIIRKLFKHCIDKKFEEANDVILGLKKKGILSLDILNGMVYFLKKCGDFIKENNKIKYLKVLSKCIVVINSGLESDLQLSNCIIELINL